MLLQLVRLSNLHLSDFPMSGEVGRDRAVTFGGAMQSTAGRTVTFVALVVVVVVVDVVLLLLCCCCPVKIDQN